MNAVGENIISATRTAFIDALYESNSEFKPKFISNNYLKGEKVLASIEDELRKCDSFIFSVAFITLGGIEPLLQTLKELEKSGVQGKILTTDYNVFTDPAALDKIALFSNIELRMYHETSINNISNDKKIGFHTKGYIFRKNETYTVIVGSSNMTGYALTVNKEWNTKVVSTKDGEILLDIMSEFDSLWNDKEHTASYHNFIDEYRIRYATRKNQIRIARQNEANIVSLEQYRLEPNKMQLEFINNLKKLKKEGKNKALLISATGTGKTYASAFGIRESINPNGKVLFVVHRKQILNQAKESYQRVFGYSKKMILLSGQDKKYNEIKNADFVFAMINMIYKEEVLQCFNKKEFSCIVFDEVHHIAASMYKRVLDYFEPDFLLGMTATPDRTDGGDIYGIFDNNIVYEIRLQQALEYNLLCPFHYFGITDITFNGVEISDEIVKRAENGEFEVFNLLTSDERVDYIVDQAAFYGYSGDRVKGLIFCASVKEAEVLSDKFNLRGFRTIHLSGKNNDKEREDAIRRLVCDDRDDYLDYIFTVDIFNEGVDVPEINQVIMLRPTESAIVFIQQLGRGLRKYDDKEFVVIIDFIGNYNNNFLIPIALSDDRTYNKDNMRKYVLEGVSIIPGASSIHFDEISKKHIFDSIDASSTPLKFLKEKYYNLKNKLGKIPTLYEFYKFGEVDPILFIEYQKGSYDKFVRKIDKEADYPNYNSEQSACLDFVSLNFANGKRLHELLIIDLLINNKEFDDSEIEKQLNKYSIKYREDDVNSAIHILKKEFTNTQSEKEKYYEVDFLNIEKNEYLQNNRYVSLLNYMETSRVKKCFIDEMNEIIKYGISRHHDYFAETDSDNLVLYQKYSRKDVCRILNWERDDSATIYGYRIKYGTCPVFVTYEKKDDISESTKYEDQFIDNSTFSWMTRNNVKIDSVESQEIIHSNEKGLKIFLFIKKSDGEGTDFYYCGRIRPESWRETIIKDNKGDERPIMNFIFKLEHPVRNDIFEYFTK